MNLNKLSRLSLLSLLLIVFLLFTSSITLGLIPDPLTITDQGYCTGPIDVPVSKVVTGDAVPEGAEDWYYNVLIWEEGNPNGGSSSSIAVNHPWTAELGPYTYTVSEPDPKGAVPSISPETFTLTEDMQPWWKIYMTIQNTSGGEIPDGVFQYQIYLNGTVIENGSIPALMGGAEYTINYLMNDDSQFGTYSIWVGGNAELGYFELYSDDFVYNEPIAPTGVTVTNDFSTNIGTDTGKFVVTKVVEGTPPVGVDTYGITVQQTSGDQTIFSHDFAAGETYEFDNLEAGLYCIAEHLVPEYGVNPNGIGDIVTIEASYEAGNSTFDTTWTNGDPDLPAMNIRIGDGDVVNVTITNKFEEAQPEYNVIVNKTIEGNKAPDDPEFRVCFEPVDRYELNPLCGFIFEGENHFLLEPGTYNVYEVCSEEPKSIEIDKEQITVGNEVVTVNITNDYGNKKRKPTNYGGGGEIVEEFPTPPPLPEPIIVAVPEPTAPAEVVEVPVEPVPELPDTGAPIAVGLGLLLAAGGLVIRRIKK